MTANYGPPTEPPASTNRSYLEARQDAVRDLARVEHGHALSWSVDLECGKIVLMCSCNNPGPYSGREIDKHLLEAVTKARGPIRGWTK